MRPPKRFSKRPTRPSQPPNPPSRPGPRGGPASLPGLGPKPSERPGHKPHDFRAVSTRPASAPAPKPRRPGKPDPARNSLRPVPGADGPEAPAARAVSHVVSVDKLAGATVAIAEAVERSVLGDGRRADRSIAYELRHRRDLAGPDHRFVSRAVFALFRWKGWIDTLHLPRIEDRLLLAWQLDSARIHPVCRVWARRLGRDPDRLIPIGDAPNWTARGDGWKRINDDRTVSADPWRLFPNWFREHLPLPPGGGSPKTRNLDLLQSLQATPSLWIRIQAEDEKRIQRELAEQGLRPWYHRRVTRAAKLGPEVDVYHLAAFERGDVEIQDLASQAVALACDPDAGERWWDVCAGAGGKALHLAALMAGKGVVVASDIHERRLLEAVRRARRSPYRNLTTRAWDGKHVVGKAGRYDGVLVDAPCSAIGTWRRNPDGRWLLKPDAVLRLAETQGQILRVGAQGVKPGGVLVYSVCTLTVAETREVVQGFLADHPDFQLDPFPHPLTGEATDGTLQIWPQDADTDAMFVARMTRAQSPDRPEKPARKKAQHEPTLATPPVAIGEEPRRLIIGDDAGEGGPTPPAEPAEDTSMSPIDPIIPPAEDQR